jgi:phage terminase large subunit-like protein
MIGREAFRLLKAEPTSHIKWVLSADFALTEKEQAPKRGHDPDFTAIVKLGLWEPVAGEARLVLSWVRKGQLGPNDALELVRRALVAEPRGTRLRSGQANVDALYLAQLRREPDLLGYSIRNVDKKVLKGDKVTLATPWIEMAQAGLFYVVENGAGVREFLQDVELFPHGAHDDVEDAISIGAAYFGLATGPQQARNVRMSFY